MLRIAGTCKLLFVWNSQSISNPCGLCRIVRLACAWALGTLQHFSTCSQTRACACPELSDDEAAIAGESGEEPTLPARARLIVVWLRFMNDEVRAVMSMVGLWVLRRHAGMRPATVDGIGARYSYCTSHGSSTARATRLPAVLVDGGSDRVCDGNAI